MFGPLFSKFKLAHYGILLIAVPMIFELCFVGVLFYQVDHLEQLLKKEDHEKRVITELSKIMGSLVYQGAGTLSLPFLSMRPIHFKHRQNAIPSQFEELERLVQDDEPQRLKIRQVREKIESLLKHFETLKHSLEDRNVLEVKRISEEGKEAVSRSLDDIERIIADQEEVESKYQNELVTYRNLIRTSIVGGFAINVLLAVFLLYVFYKQTSKKLAIVMGNSVRLIRKQPLHPPLEGEDEISQLDRVFHLMARSLEELAENAQTAMENASDVIFTINDKGYLVDVSPASFHVLGYHPEDLLRLTVRQFVEASDANRVIQTLSGMKNVNEFGEANEQADFECRVKKSDGELLDTLWSVRWAEMKNSYYCILHDITERKRAENLLRDAHARITLIIESMPIGLVIINEHGAIELINSSVSKMFGKQITDLNGQSIATLFTRPAAVSEDEFTRDMIEKTRHQNKEYESINARGNYLPVEVALNEFQTLQGTRYLALLVDVTQRHEMERLKQQFISMVSHELRSPLNSVLGFLEMLPEGVYGSLNEQGLDKTAVAERNITRLMRLINDLLDIDKLEAGRLNMEMEETELEPVFQRSIEAVRHLAEKAKINIVTPNTDAIVTADGDRLVQVLVNLFANAIKFSPANSTISVGLKLDRDWYEIRVQDQGRGIPAQFKDRIFEKFQQVEAGDSRKLGGTGLGLAICKAIVEQHGGAMGVDSEEGKGSCFWFKIPAQVHAVAQ